MPGRFPRPGAPDRELLDSDDLLFGGVGVDAYAVGYASRDRCCSVGGLRESGMAKLDWEREL